MEPPIAGLQTPISKPTLQRPNTENQERSKASAQPWTSSRCHLLLRPLQSRIASLETILDDYARDTVQNSSQGKRKIITYSSKAKPRKLPPQQPPGPTTLPRSESSPGEIEVKTPFFKRLKYHPGCTPHGFSSPATPAQDRVLSTDGRLEEKIAAIRQTASLDLCSAYDSVFRAFSSLIKATAADNDNGLRSNSLLAMCLRQVPTYILRLEYWYQKDLDDEGNRSLIDDTSVSFEVYTYLEDLGPTAGRGWRYLGALLRFHAADLLKQLILKHQVHATFGAVLVQLCLDMGFLHEAQHIIDALVDRPFPAPKIQQSTFWDGHLLTPLAVLLEYSRKGERPAYLFRKLSGLISSGNLPREWLATTEFGQLFVKTVRHVSTSSSACSEAGELISTAISALSRPARQPFHNRRVQRHVAVSLISLLTAVVLIPQHEADNSSTITQPSSPSPSSQKRVQLTLQTCISRLSPHSSLEAKFFAYVCHIALIFILQRGRGDIGILSGLVLAAASKKRGLGGRDGIFDLTSMFLCSTSQYLGRGTKSAPYSILARLCHQLGKLDGLLGEEKEDAKAMASSIMKDSAFRLALRTKNLRDLVFAEGVVAALGSEIGEGKGRDGSPFGSIGVSKGCLGGPGYRWEEGINEWVVVSPGLNRGGKRKREGDVDVDVMKQRTRQKLFGPQSKTRKTEMGKYWLSRGAVNNPFPSASGSDRSDAWSDSEDELSL